MAHYDVIIIGSGAGGGTLAHALAKAGKRILLIERGDFLPREKENWEPRSIFLEGRYKTDETWFDKKGKPFHPGTYYHVGGNTKVYGAALFRLREEDFGEIRHHGGLSPAWPLKYEDFQPYYQKAEELFHVHGERGTDSTEPTEKEPYPYPAFTHEPRIQTLFDGLKAQGLHPFPIPLGLHRNEKSPEKSPCIRCDTCDGFPCLVDAKSDAEISCVNPSLALPNFTLLTNAKALHLIPQGKSIKSVVVEKVRQGSKEEELGWHAHTKMILGGGDVTWGKYLHLGVAAGYATNHIHWTRGRGKGETRDTFGTAYISATPRWLYLNGLFTYGYNTVSASRHMRFSIFDRIAKHHQHNRFLQAGGELGLRLGKDPLQLRPFGKVDYIRFHEKGYHEMGADGLNLVVNGVDPRLLRYEAGANLSACIGGTNVQWVIEGQGSWIKEKRSHGKHYTARFQETDVFFTVTGFYPSRTLWAAGGGLSAQLLKAPLSLSLYYDLQKGSQYTNQAFTLQINLPFGCKCCKEKDASSSQLPEEKTLLERSWWSGWWK